jgi:predicted esterase
LTGVGTDGGVGCPPGFSPLGDASCLAAPPGRADGRKLIVFFHGMAPANVDPAGAVELGALAEEAGARGFAVLALRGEQGLCDWSDPVRSSWCWPSRRTQLTRVQPILLRLGGALESASARLGVPLDPPFLLGFSNGGFFVSLLASDTRLEASGYAVLHGGWVDGQTFPSGRARPTLLISARDDRFQRPLMDTLDAKLREAGWKPTYGQRDGEHALTREDARAAVTFFDGVLAATCSGSEAPDAGRLKPPPAKGRR